MESNEKLLIGTIGYQLLGNHSVGPKLLPVIKKLDWPHWVEVDELNWGPIAIVQQFETMETPYNKVFLLGAIERPDRKIGDIDVYKWEGGLPSETQIQACIGDAATGVISVENLLVIGEYFKIWPKDVYLIDVEPGPEVAGDELRYGSEDTIVDILSLLKDLVLGSEELTISIKKMNGETLFNLESHGTERN